MSNSPSPPSSPQRARKRTTDAEVESSSQALVVPPPKTTTTTSPSGDIVEETVTITPDGRKVIKKIIRKKRRPARPQVDPSTFKTEPPPQTGTIFNIWYNKWSGGDREDKYLAQHAAPGRCNVAKDSGYTKADKVPGSYFCLFFARGLCPKGKECEYLHRLPTIHDIFNPNVDCFGRDKFSDYRDDMGGVGSFLRQNRTLYVGRIHPSDDIEEVVARHFQEWGQIDRSEYEHFGWVWVMDGGRGDGGDEGLLGRIRFYVLYDHISNRHVPPFSVLALVRVLTSRGVAFITYSNEANSQFAKEAMAHQALDNNEVLNLRWATVDPNPAAQKREARAIEEQAAEAIRQALPADYIAEIEGRLPDAKRRRMIASADRNGKAIGYGHSNSWGNAAHNDYGLEGYDAPDTVRYGDTKHLEQAQERWLLEAAAAAEREQEEEEAAQRKAAKDAVGGNSILSHVLLNTLASIDSNAAKLQTAPSGLSGGRGGDAPPLATAAAKKASSAPGPLVGYGSDDDDDDY